MTSQITDSLGGQSASPAAQASSQQQRVQKALDQMPPSNATAAPRPGRDELVKAAQRVNEALQPYGVEFELSEESSRIITRIVDQESGELIRQIPAEAVLRIAERLPEFQGLLLEQEV